MRLLLADPPVTTDRSPGDLLTDDQLAQVYAPPAQGWVRANFVSTIDGAVTGSDGRSGSINTEADHVAFDLLRALADIVLVGAGTARIEGYTALEVSRRFAPIRARAGKAATLPLALVTRSGVLPALVTRSDPDRPVIVVTTTRCPQLSTLRRHFGRDHVITSGRDDLDLPLALDTLRDKGFRDVLCEGGPSLLSDLARSGRLDELCLSWAPHLLGGRARRLLPDGRLQQDLRPVALIDQDGTLMGRWLLH